MQSSQNLIWIDLEMTGLDPDHDTILEAAMIITDSQLQTIYESPAMVIHQPDQILAAMNSWCQEQHGRSGLIAAVRQSSMTLSAAAEDLYNTIETLCVPKTPLLCGNSVFYDRAFLRRLMPRIEAYLHHRIIDVSTVSELIQRWYPHDPQRLLPAAAAKHNLHRALPDIQESIAQLRHYRSYFFKGSVDVPGTEH